jgi:putative toxin-antitoxin system antitoxin component (TIGR02293 family)
VSFFSNETFSFSFEKEPTMTVQSATPAPGSKAKPIRAYPAAAPSAPQGVRAKRLDDGVLRYAPKQFDAFMRAMHTAPPMQLLETERHGVDAAFLAAMAERMAVSYSYLAEALGIAKATAARKLANNEKLNGAAVMGLARLLALASDIVADSTAPEAQKFDTAQWLGQWIEQPQPALGGRKPWALLDTPTGVAMVTKLLGAIRSGTYQ